VLGSLLTVSTISRVAVIHINQPQAAETDVKFSLSVSLLSMTVDSKKHDYFIPRMEGNLP
jgi:hypothetical protein